MAVSAATSIRAIGGAPREDPMGIERIEVFVTALLTEGLV
jgi:hypothetical protein